jgi:uncharacterized protein YcbK (DUF882 family)
MLAVHRRTVSVPAAKLLVPFSVVILLLCPVAANGQRRAHGRSDGARVHVVVAGETLSQIAREYGVTTRAVQEANDIDDPDRIRVGQELRIPGAEGPDEEQGREAAPQRAERGDAPGASGSREAHVGRGGVVLYVEEGQTLSDIAGSYGVSVSRLLRANDIDDANAIRVGQRILVPGATEVKQVRRVRREPPNSAPVTFYRVATDESVTVELFDGHGRLRAAARAQVDRLFRQPTTGRQHRINTELLRLVQRVAEHWPGKRIMVYSGYRPHRRSQYAPHSKHNVGRAVDFRVEDVSNREVRDFCRALPRAGVGYYPNSRFVHLDARDRRAYWVDYSGPGEAPRYGRERPEAEEGDEGLAEGADGRGDPSADQPAGSSADAPLDELGAGATEAGSSPASGGEGERESGGAGTVSAGEDRRVGDAAAIAAGSGAGAAAGP